MSWWAGHMSVCKKGGPLENFIKSLAPEAVIVEADGMMVSGPGLLNEHEYPEAPIVCMLCTRVPKPNMLLMPLDDATFLFGLNLRGPEWNRRLPIAFWRGGASGFEVPNTRVRVVETLIDHPNADVKITPWYNWEDGKNIPPQFFGNRCEIATHLYYKYILIVDGNCIASSHQWVFGSGSVPIMVTHPDNDYWFKRYLKPMVHYVPIQYDLSDLAEKITWLVEHDDEAKKIADNAMAFSKLFFSPEFQRNHLIAEIGRIRQCMNGTGSPEKASPLPEWDPLKMAPGPSG